MGKMAESEIGNSTSEVLKECLANRSLGYAGDCRLTREFVTRFGMPLDGGVPLDGSDALRGLPPVGAVLEHEVLVASVRTRGRAAVLRAVRAAIEEARRGLRGGRPDRRRPGESGGAVASRSWTSERASLRPVINATGVLLHTGLGRAPLAEEAIEAVAAVARGYCSLELELEDGERGRRTAGIDGCCAS